MNNEQTQFMGGTCRHHRSTQAQVGPGEPEPCVYCTLTDITVSQNWLKTLEALRQASTISAVLKDVKNGGKLQLAGFMISIGRSSNNQVVLKDDAVSRSHALITCEDDKYFISDLGSTNGTLVNGSPLRTRQRLMEGDVIRMGETMLCFSTERNSSLPFANAYVHA